MIYCRGINRKGGSLKLIEEFTILIEFYVQTNRSVARRLFKSWHNMILERSLVVKSRVEPL